MGIVIAYFVIGFIISGILVAHEKREYNNVSGLPFFIGLLYPLYLMALPCYGIIRLIEYITNKIIKRKN